MYTLDLTEEDVSAIEFVGGRYCWAEAISSLGEGRNEIPEHEMWEIKEEFEKDTEGGHSFFPHLNHDSELAGKLFTLMYSVV